jgi:hypothetical protein
MLYLTLRRERHPSKKLSYFPWKCDTSIIGLHHQLTAASDMFTANGLVHITTFFG